MKTLPRHIEAYRLTPGRWLEILGAGHGVVGVVLHRRALLKIVRRGVVATVPDRGDRATAFWFITLAPTLWAAGHLLRAAEAADDRPAQRAAGIAFVAIGLAGGVMLPASPFWIVASAGVVAVRRGSRSAND